MMGHGISASLVCMFISSVLREAIKSLIDPEQVITELNRYMELLHSEKDEIPYYFTAIYLVIDTEAKTVEYVNAGHPEGYMLVDEHTLVPLQRGSCPVGFLKKWTFRNLLSALRTMCKFCYLQTELLNRWALAKMNLLFVFNNLLNKMDKSAGIYE